MRLLRRDIVANKLENLTPYDKLTQDELHERINSPYVRKKELYIHPEQGLLHGIYRLRRGKNYGLFYINGGYLMRAYEYPALQDLKFKHAMVNCENLHMCGGWHWITNVSSNETILNRVLTGIKPAGQIYCQLNEFPGDIELVRKDFDVSFKMPHYINIAPRKTFGEMFDLEALNDDYQSYSNAVNCDLFYDVRSFKNITLSKVINSIDSFEELPIEICGLLLGFAIETTVSCVLQSIPHPKGWGLCERT